MAEQERVPVGREETEPGAAEVPHRHWLGHPALLLGIVVILAIVAIVGIPRSHGTKSTGVKLQPTNYGSGSGGKGGTSLAFTGPFFLPKGTKCILVWVPGSGGGSAQFNCADGPTLVPASPISAAAIGFLDCPNTLKTKQGQLWTCEPLPSSNSTSDISTVAKTKLPTVKTATMSTGTDWSSWIGSGAGALGALAALGAFLVSLKHH
jgi:hypothetical protein